MRKIVLKILFMVMAVATFTSSLSANGVDTDGYKLPLSELMSESRKVASERDKDILKAWLDIRSRCRSPDDTDINEMAEVRKCLGKAYYQSDLYKGLIQKYPVTITPKIMNGVYTEVVTSKEGVSAKNVNRVLINVHGGGFKEGARWGGRMESIPVSSVGKIKVVSIDYRMGPEHRFPAASKDVETVYRALLKTYSPENIGIYGCSAGGMLTGQSMAWFIQEQLPVPGAIGMFCGAASHGAGDAWDRNAALSGGVNEDYSAYIKENTENSRSYFLGANMQSSLIVPAHYDEIISKFPPSLIISSTRDYMLSAAIHTHRQLTRLGVVADFHVWEGLGHGFFLLDYNIPESEEVHDVTVDFFDRYLGQKYLNTTPEVVRR